MTNKHVIYHKDTILNMNFKPELRRIYTVRVQAYGKKGVKQLSAVKFIERTTFVINNIDHFVMHVSARLGLKKVHQMDVEYLNANGFIVNQD